MTAPELLFETEHPISPEYGAKNTVPLPLWLLVRLSQSRQGRNPQLDQLKESIRTKGLINQVDVAKLSPANFNEYVQFVNGIWGSSHQSSDYQTDEDGYYYLVIAGHSRIEAITELEMERAQADTSVDPLTALVHCKIHQDPTPAEILALQLDENIYKAPSEERRAMAMVETYRYGLINGQWQSQAEFLRCAGDKFSVYALRRALSLTNLTPQLMDFVLSGAVKYGPATELAMALPDYRSYLLAQYFDNVKEADLDAERAAELADQVNIWAAIQLEEIRGKKLNITIAKKRYAELAASWRRQINGSDTEQSLFGVDMMRATQRQEWRNLRERMRRQHADIMNALQAAPFSEAARALRLHTSVHGDPGLTEELAGDLVRRIRAIEQCGGRSSLIAVSA